MNACVSVSKLTTLTGWLMQVECAVHVVTHAVAPAAVLSKVFATQSDMLPS